MVVKNEMVLFWRGKFSQWYKSPMYDPETGLTFNCAEQYMMYGKARLFGDEDAMNDIMVTDSPKEQQTIGRRVKNFDPAVWDEACIDIVTRGNYLKFSQNPELLAELMKYTDHTFVEASPIDRIWGIGLDENNPDALDTEKWRGKNYLGQCINNAMERIINDQHYWLFHEQNNLR